MSLDFSTLHGTACRQTKSALDPTSSSSETSDDSAPATMVRALQERELRSFTSETTLSESQHSTSLSQHDAVLAESKPSYGNARLQERAASTTLSTLHSDLATSKINADLNAFSQLEAFERFLYGKSISKGSVSSFQPAFVNTPPAAADHNLSRDASAPDKRLPPIPVASSEALHDTMRSTVRSRSNSFPVHAETQPLPPPIPEIFMSVLKGEKSSSSHDLESDSIDLHRRSPAPQKPLPRVPAPRKQLPPLPDAFDRRSTLLTPDAKELRRRSSFPSLSKKSGRSAQMSAARRKVPLTPTTSAKVSRLTRTLFEKYDKDQDGALSRDEFRLFVSDLGYRLSSDEIRSAFNFIDRSRSGFIDYEEFREWCSPDNRYFAMGDGARGTLSTSEIRAAFEAFQSFDVDKSGFVDRAEFDAMYDHMEANGLTVNNKEFMWVTLATRSEGDGDRELYVRFNSYIEWLGRSKVKLAKQISESTRREVNDFIL